MPDVAREDYLASCDGDRFVDQMRYVRAYATELPVLGGLLPGIDTPVQIITGRNDPVVPVANAECLHEHLPHSRLDVIEAGHFVREEAADDFAAAITTWWQANAWTPWPGPLSGRAGAPAPGRARGPLSRDLHCRRSDTADSSTPAEILPTVRTSPLWRRRLSPCPGCAVPAPCGETRVSG